MGARRPTTRSGFCRQLTGWIAAFALVWQSLLVATAFAPLAGTDAAAAPGFELCLHDTGDAGIPAKAPDSAHCPICFCGSPAFVLLSPVQPRMPAPLAADSAAWAVVASAVPTLPKPPHRRPRGPPLDA
jgi:hypothetical protein